MAEKNERDLEEVERALSVLGGRHPEQVRAQREAAEATERRRAEHDRQAAADRKRSMKRGAIGAFAVVVVGAAALSYFRFQSSRAAIDAELAPLVGRYTALGFDALPRGTFAPEDRAEVTTNPGDCYAFTAARGAQMRIERPIGSSGAQGEALVCTCASENVVVTTIGAAPLRALHVAGNTFGGSRAVPYRFHDHPPTIVAGDDACADDALAAFARDRRYGKQDADGAWLAAHPAFVESGFTTVASAPAALPFVFVDGSGAAGTSQRQVDPAASRCYVAAGADLTLWTIADQAQKPLHGKGAIAWCAEKEAPFVVEHASGAGMTVVSAPSKRIGGALGLREIAARASLPVSVWMRDEERAEIAADALRASVVPDPVAVPAQTIEASQTKDARVLVFSTTTRETFSSNEADFRCAPALGEPESLCVQLRALTWRAPPPGVVCAAAYGPLPFWMSVLADIHDPAAVDAQLALVTIARKLSARGFSPGVIEGVTERADSVEILGRSGDDAVVAIGIWPVAPFIHPYSDDMPWSLDGEPRVIPLAGGARVSLPVHGANVPVEKRRTVVFRRSTK